MRKAYQEPLQERSPWPGDLAAILSSLFPSVFMYECREYLVFAHMYTCIMCQRVAAPVHAHTEYARIWCLAHNKDISDRFSLPVAQRVCLHACVCIFSRMYSMCHRFSVPAHVSTAYECTSSRMYLCVVGGLPDLCMAEDVALERCSVCICVTYNFVGTSLHNTLWQMRVFLYKQYDMKIHQAAF